MPNITPRKNKNGEITSYTIRVYHGYDSNGKRLKPYTMSYKPAQGMTSKQIEKEVQRIATLFEEQCKQGLSNEKLDTIEHFEVKDKGVYGTDQIGNSYKICECMSCDISDYVCNILNFFRDIQ